MSRLNRPTAKSENPTTKFLSWKSSKNSFSYYDKEKEDNIVIKLPLKIAFLEHYHTIKGFHNKSESGIFSNEVFSIANEELNVRSFKGGEIDSGLYKDIKHNVKDNGGIYHRSIYCVDTNYNLINLSFKGSVVSAYSDFCKENSNKFEQKWIEITDFVKKTKGATKYTVPIFKIGDNFTKEEDNKIVEVASILQKYMDSYLDNSIDNSKSKEYLNNIEVKDEEEVPF